MMMEKTCLVCMEKRMLGTCFCKLHHDLWLATAPEHDMSISAFVTHPKNLSLVDKDGYHIDGVF